MFSKFFGQVRASEATVIVERALSINVVGYPPVSSPSDLANKIMAIVYVQSPNLFSTKNGPRCHRMALASISLAAALEEYPENSQESNACYFALGGVLLLIERSNFPKYFTGMDFQVIALSQKKYIEYSERAGKTDIDTLQEIAKWIDDARL